MVVGVLAAFATAVYVAVVVGIGALVGSRGGEPSVLLAVVATAVVAVAFQPVRQRAQRLADRVVYGERATPYDVLSDFSERLAGAFATQDLAAHDGEDARGGDGRRSCRRVVALRRTAAPGRIVAPRYRPARAGPPLG